jgi:hypothetical protein
MLVLVCIWRSTPKLVYFWSEITDVVYEVYSNEQRKIWFWWKLLFTVLQEILCCISLKTTPTSTIVSRLKRNH